jgi:hypothetical protein
MGEFIVAVNHINPYIWGRQPNNGFQQSATDGSSLKL